MFKTLKNEKGEAYVGEGVKVVVCVVLGAALLAGLVFTMNKTLLPRTQQFIRNMFGQASVETEDLFVNGDKSSFHRDVLGVIKNSINEKYQGTKYEDMANDFASILNGQYKESESWNGSGRLNKSEVEEYCKQKAMDSSLSEEERQVYQDLLSYKDEFNSVSYQSRLQKFQAECTELNALVEKGSLSEEEFFEQVKQSAKDYGFEVSF